MTTRGIILAMALTLALAAPVLAAERETLNDEIDVLGSEEAVTSWKGQLELGAFYNAGNTDRLGFNFGAAAALDSSDNLFETKFSAVYSEEDKARSENEQFFSFRHNHKFHPWYTLGILSLERDEFEDLDLRLVFSPGLGYVIEDTDDVKMSVEFGPSALYQDYDEGDSEWEFELRVGFRGEFALFDAAKLVEELAIYPSMSDSGEYRIQSETSFEQPLSDVLFFKISALFYYNSTVPEGVDKQDTKILASLVYKF